MSLTVADSRRERPTTMPAAERARTGYGGLVVPVVGVGIASGFIGDFAAVLTLSVLLAALCLVALASVGRAPAPDGTMVSR